MGAEGCRIKREPHRAGLHDVCDYASREPLTAGVLYRKRRRGGLLYVRVPLHVTEIDMLIERGLLEARNSTDRKAISTAICDLLAELL